MSPARRILPVALAAVAALGIGYGIYRVTRPSAEPVPALPSPKDLLREARERRQVGDLRGAADLYEQILAGSPAPWEARAGLAHVYQALGYHERALPHLEAAHAEKPEEVEVQIALGETLLVVGERERAVRVLQAAVRSPSGERAFLALGDAYMDLERWDRAEEAYRDALRADSTDSAARLRLHRSLLSGGKLAEAERLVKEHPTGADALLMETALLRERGEFDVAIGRILLKSASGQEWLEVARTKSQLLLEAGRYDEAATLSEEILRQVVEPSQILRRADAGFLRVLALLLGRKREEAVRAASATLESLDPQVTSIGSVIQALLFVGGRITAEQYLEGVERLPKRAHNDHFLFLGAQALSEGRVEDGRRYLARARDRTVGRNYPHYLIESLIRAN